MISLIANSSETLAKKELEREREGGREYRRGACATTFEDAVVPTLKEKEQGRFCVIIGDIRSARGGVGQNTVRANIILNFAKHSVIRITFGPILAYVHWCTV